MLSRGKATLTATLLCLLTLLVPPAGGRSRTEALFEHVSAESIKELLEARYPLVHLVLHPTMNGFYFEPSRKPAALEQASFSLELAKSSKADRPRPPFLRQILAIKNLVPLLDQPAVHRTGTASREYQTENTPSAAWVIYLRARYPDLVVSPHRDGHGFCAFGQEEQLNGTSELVRALEDE